MGRHSVIIIVISEVLKIAVTQEERHKYQGYPRKKDVAEHGSCRL